MTVLQIIAIVFFAIAIILLAVTIALFFTENIAEVIGYFSGRTERKQIEQIREQNQNISYGVKKSRIPSNSNNFDNLYSVRNPDTEERSNIQIGSHPSKLLNHTKNNTNAVEANAASEIKNGGTMSLDSIIGENVADASENETAVLSSDETMALDNESDTEILEEALTDVLNEDGEFATSVLDDNETSVLSDEIEKNEVFEILDTNTFINTQENIE